MSFFHKHERKILEEYLNCFKTEIKGVNPLKDNFEHNPKYLQLKANIEFSEKLLGR